MRDFEEPFGTLMLELPLRDAGFVLPTWDELTDTVEAARERDAVVHFDGARLWECTPHFGRPLPEIAGLADSVYVSFYKSLGGLSGAALAGSADLVGRGEDLAAPLRRACSSSSSPRRSPRLSACAPNCRGCPRTWRTPSRSPRALREGLADGGRGLAAGAPRASRTPTSSSCGCRTRRTC